MPIIDTFTVTLFVALFILFVLSLPIPHISRFVATLFSAVIRLVLLGLLASSVYLWFSPDQLPSQVSGWYRLIVPVPVQEVLPQPGVPTFGATCALVLWIILLPILVAMDHAARFHSLKSRTKMSHDHTGRPATESSSTTPSALPSTKKKLPVRDTSSQSAAEKMAAVKERGGSPRLSDFIE